MCSEFSMDLSAVEHYDSSLVLESDESQTSMWDSNYDMTADSSATFMSANSTFTEQYDDAEYQETQTVLTDELNRFGVSTCTFDPVEELMWMGNQGGLVASYYGSSLQKYTSFKVHASHEIRQIHPMDEGILVLTQNALRYQLRRGIPIFTTTSENMIDMQCMLEAPGDQLLMGGHQEHIVDYNLARGEETGLIHVGASGCAILRKHSKFICAGSPDGKIELRDPNTLGVEHSFTTHTGSLSDFDVQGNYLATCGFSASCQGLVVDRFLMVYDLRQMRALAPVRTMMYPLLLKFLPSYSSRLAVVASMGQMQLLDAVYPDVQPAVSLYQIATAGEILAFDVSQTSKCLSFGDSVGAVHLMATKSSDPQFNAFCRPTEFADPVETHETLAIDDNVTPLSTVPMVYTGHPLASDWPEEFLIRAYRITPPVDPEILRTMKTTGTVGYYAVNPHAIRKHKSPLYQQRQVGAVGARAKTEFSSVIPIPIRYRLVPIVYSRIGRDDFDFDKYNHTSFSGLEASLPNSYCNAMLQVLYYSSSIRLTMLSHKCQKEFCLSCELQNLFHMFDISKGAPCQASNFLRAFRTIPQASGLGLILSDLHAEDKRRVSLTRLIQSWYRFIIHHVHSEIFETKKRQQEEEEAERMRLAPKAPQFVYNEQDFPSIMRDLGARHKNHDVEKKKRRKQEEDGKYMWITTKDTSNKKSTGDSEARDEDSEIGRIFGTRQKLIQQCLKCGREGSKNAIMLLSNLQYPNTCSPTEEIPFTDILSRSLKPEKVTPAWCDTCRKYFPTLETRQVTKLPKILAFNCGLDNPHEKKVWQTQTDIVVQNAMNGRQGDASSASPLPPTARLCRYGDHCVRPGCRFRHIGKTLEPKPAAPPPPAVATSSAANTGAPYYEHSWLPHDIEVTLGEKGELSVKKINKSSSGNVKTNFTKSKVFVENNQDDQHTPSDSENELTELASPDTLEDSDPENPLINEIKKPKITKVRYTLTAVVCHIDDKANDKRHLVALIRVGPNYHERSTGSAVAQWYIFNDFSITAVTPEEAVWFNLDWKVPCILHYTASPDLEPEVRPLVSPFTYDVFGEDKCIALNGPTTGITFTPLTSDEMPKKGELVGIDAEFVTLNQKESELRSDGKMSTIKPSHMSVARITCIRGHGPLEGTPFIDDYISTQEQVVDYLTQFSGILPGDLDANFSSKHLTTLKSTYQKLRFLVDNGIIFVGHGLQNDFRVINLVVPPEQVIDTVVLFRLPHRRMVSLRFLTWHFLGRKIQSETHDSTEDARAALELYRKYQHLEKTGKIRDALAELYNVGNTLKWKVPEES